ncbi:MAG: ABC transporter ATP-binding protein [Planctomycetaceae bacterium]|nr:ABC transporter ATP-binding protein [Planctomycetaceae bacterium]
METPRLSGRRLVLNYGSGEAETRALRGVSLELTPGQVTLVMGPSGCGKTTLLFVLAGLLPPSGGQVSFGGRDLYALSAAARREFRRRHVGFIFQGFNLFPTLTVREQLEMVLRWGEGLPAGEAARRTQQMLERLDLTRQAELLPPQLSGGEQQRVAIGRALIKGPDLLFADEPTSALDGDHGKQVMEILSRAAHEQSCMVLVVAHDPRVVPFAERILPMEDGHWKGPDATAENPPGPDHGKELVHL